MQVEESYDVFPDGSFVAVATDPDAPPARAIVVLNWLEQLKRLVPIDE
jgi:hypothetical protein